MTYETILYSVADDVATITLNRPEVMNGLNARMRREITDALALAAAAARVLGADRRGARLLLGPGSRRRGPARGARPRAHAARGIRADAAGDLRLPDPDDRRGERPAAGAGANLALAADVVIAARSATFVQAFARIGLIPDAGGTYWLPRQVGFARAMGAALFADKIGAEQAEAWGMIWEAVPDEDFAATVAARAQALAQGPTLAYRLIKRALRASFSHDLDAQLALEAELQGEAGRSRDFREGVAAFLEKRPARFEGR